LWWEWWCKKNEIGRSKGGCTTKIHALTDTNGKPLQLRFTQGQVHDSVVALDLMDFIHADACLADKAYDTNLIVNELKERGIGVCIPPRKNRKKKRRIDKELYALRYRVECFFHDIKRFRRVATRFEKKIETFKGMVLWASAFQWII
jgi:transposase